MHRDSHMAAKSLRRTIVLCSLLFSLALGLAALPKLTLVEVWCGGDDGLTTKLRDSLENVGRPCQHAGRKKKDKKDKPAAQPGVTNSGLQYQELFV